MHGSASPFWSRQARLAVPMGLLFVALVSRPMPVVAFESGGTGVGLGVLEHLATAFGDQHSDRRIHVIRPSLGSSGGIKGVEAARLAVSISARRLKESEKKAGLVEHPLCRTPYVIAVSQTNPTEESLSVDDLAAIIRESQTWPDGTRARFIMRPRNDSMTTLLKSMGPAVAAAVDAVTARPNTVYFETDQDAADAIEKIDGGVGGTALSLILAEHRPLKPLPLAGVAPTLDALADGRYPYSIELTLVTRQAPSADVATFLAFVRSEAAAKVLRHVGCLPMGR